MVEKKKSLIGKSVDIKATQLECRDESDRPLQRSHFEYHDKSGCLERE